MLATWGLSAFWLPVLCPWQLSWFRIILDEAHYIKSRSTSTANAVFALTSLNKWGLTGTPLQVGARASEAGGS